MYFCSKDQLRKINSHNAAEPLAEVYGLLDRTMQKKHHFLFVEGIEEASACEVILPRRADPSLSMYVLNNVFPVDGRRTLAVALENVRAEHLVLTNICGSMEGEVIAAYLDNDKCIVPDSRNIASHGKFAISKLLQSRGENGLSQMMRPIENLPEIMDRYFAAPFGNEAMPEVSLSPRRQVIAPKTSIRPADRREPPFRIREGLQCE